MDAYRQHRNCRTSCGKNVKNVKLYKRYAVYKHVKTLNILTHARTGDEMICKIGICDDNRIILRQLEGYLTRLQGEIEEEIVPSYFTSGEEVLSDLAEDTDILILDIAMGGINGIETAKRLRAKGVRVPIIFVTSMVEYALDGYAVHAFGFIQKPATYADFAGVIKDALRSVKEKPEKKSHTILVNTAEGVCVIDSDEILYAEVYQHETSIVFVGKRVNANIQLSTVEPMLVPYGFFRCHRAYLVSFSKIVFIGKDTLTMKNGDRIPLSKHRRKQFLDAYTRHMGVVFQ